MTSRDRILSEAEGLFAQKGYHGVSIREITTAAECNVAAVNYYFGNKENLYLEVFRSRWIPRAKLLRDQVMDYLSSEQAPSPEIVVRAMAKAFLEGPLQDEERHLHHQLMFRELSWPTKAFDLVAEEVMGPFTRELAKVLYPAMPADLEEGDIMLYVLSIFSVILYYNFARGAVTRATGREYDPGFRASLVEHIVRFVFTGLGSERGEEIE